MKGTNGPCTAVLPPLLGWGLKSSKDLEKTGESQRSCYTAHLQHRSLRYESTHINPYYAYSIDIVLIYIYIYTYQNSWEALVPQGQQSCVRPMGGATWYHFSLNRKAVLFLHSHCYTTFRLRNGIWNTSAVVATRQDHIGPDSRKTSTPWHGYRDYQSEESFQAWRWSSWLKSSGVRWVRQIHGQLSVIPFYKQDIQVECWAETWINHFLRLPGLDLDEEDLPATSVPRLVMLGWVQNCWKIAKPLVSPSDMSRKGQLFLI